MKRLVLSIFFFLFIALNTKAACSVQAGVVSNVTCNGQCTGIASVLSTTGVAPYTYLWNPSGLTGTTASYLCAGIYVVTVTDAVGCSATSPAITITQPPALTTGGSHTNVTCNGQCNASAWVAPGGGTPPYTYAWDVGNPPFGQTMTGLCGNTAYTCMVYDQAGCFADAGFSIMQPAILTATEYHSNATSCALSNGSASVYVTGGTPGYTYLWSPTGQNTQTCTNLSGGCYTCTVTDSHGCSATATACLSQPNTLTSCSSQANVPCYGGNGCAYMCVNGGVPPYTYSWAPAVGTGATACNLTAGAYTCTVTDGGGCTAATVFSMTQPPVLTAVGQTVSNLLCYHVCTGSAAVSSNGGTAPYTYHWSPSGGNGTTATNLCAGVYTVTVTDAHGCTITSTTTITQPPPLTAVGQTINNVSCFAGNNGSASVNPGGGTPTYTYQWSPSGGTSQTVSNLATGTYTVTVTDAHGCTITSSVSITEPMPLTLGVGSSNASCTTCTNGFAGGFPSGGTPGYTYAWTPSGQTTQTATALLPGTYTCCVTDSRGCSTCGTVTVGSGCNVPVTQATNISFSNVTTSSMKVSWTNGNGNRRIVKIKTSNSFTSPVNGNDYLANTVYSGIEQVVYNGWGNSVTVTGLASNTLYWFRVYEANCTGTNSTYDSPAASGNPRSRLTQPSQNPNRPEGDSKSDDDYFQIYPNPAHNILNVECNTSTSLRVAELKIYDMTGRIVLDEILHSPLSTVNCPLSTGLYLVRVEAGDKVYQQKLVVE